MTNVLSESLTQAQTIAMYNEHCKALLSCRQILSRILYSVTEEFKEVPIDTIYDCIEGTPEISTHPLFKDAIKNERIIGSDTVDTVPHEGTTTYDIRFATYAPTSDNYVKMYMNIEAQKNFYTEYPLTTRGIYYCSRMISSQYGTEFSHSEYGKIKKVYSIWICLNSPVRIGNSIIKYSIRKEDMIGYFPDNKDEYDKMTLIFIYLNQNVDNTCPLTSLLNTIFSKTLTVAEKTYLLKKNHQIILENNEKERLNYMCNLGEGLVEEVTEEVTERVTASVTASVTANDIKRTASILQKTGIDIDSALQLISEEYQMNAEEVKKILNS